MFKKNLIDIRVFWDTLHAQIRGRIISYAGRKKRSQNMEENKINKKIELLEEEQILDPTDLENKEKLIDLKNKLQEIREIKLKGALLRSRANITNFNEKPTKFFLNLENKNFISKNIRELKLKDGSKIHKPGEILVEMSKFYTKLYSKQEAVDINNTSFKGIDDKLPKLTENEKINLEREITEEELKEVIKRSKNNKSPGPDGYSNEFYKIFWPELNKWMLKLFKKYREDNILNQTQLGGIITCIPKGEKSRNELKNWRPITLLNSTYKLYSAILADRIKITLNKLIHPDQKGFIKGRFIGENVRQTFDMINYCNENKIKGLIVLIDFEKAFDSIDWEFISKTLKFFNFGNNIINWMKSIQINSYSYIVQNGHISDKVLLHRGCRQGDPVSPYIFVLAAEIMATAIRHDKQIEGIMVYTEEQKNSLYADDTTLYLTANEKNLIAALELLKQFQGISGLKVNIDKTKIIKIGVWGDSRDIYCIDRKLIWTNKFVSLGITFDVDNMQQITEINMEQKIIEIHKLIRLWLPRFLTPIGKITIIKSLLTSKFIHILLSLPSPSKETFDKIEHIYYNFLWDSKPAKFRKEILYNPIEEGGLKYPNLAAFDKSLKITWLRRILKEDKGWCIFPTFFKIHKIFLFGDMYLNTLLKTCTNQFWRDVILSYQSLYNSMWGAKNVIHNTMPIWFNTKICTYFNKEWFEKGIMFVNDLFVEGKFVTIEYLRNIIGVKCNFLGHAIIKSKVMNLNVKVNTINFLPILPEVLRIIQMNGNGCQNIYSIIQKKSDNIITTLKEKWEQLLNDEVSEEDIQNAFKITQKSPKCVYNRYVQFKILHVRLNTRQLLHKMKISDTNECIFCKNQIDTTVHALIECPETANIWRHGELWLRQHINRSIKISDKEKIFGISGNKPYAFLLNMFIICTKLTIYQRRPDGQKCKLWDILRLIKNEMLADEYSSELNQNITNFNLKWGAYKRIIG